MRPTSIFPANHFYFPQPARIPPPTSIWSLSGSYLSELEIRPIPARSSTAAPSIWRRATFGQIGNTPHGEFPRVILEGSRECLLPPEAIWTPHRRFHREIWRRRGERNAGDPRRRIAPGCYPGASRQSSRLAGGRPAPLPPTQPPPAREEKR